MKTRIIIADDHRVFIDGMKALLKEFPEIEIVGEALNGDQLIELTLNLRPDVVITDVQMPGKDGIEAAREICRQLPGMKIIALTMLNESIHIRKMLEAGVSGYIFKSADKQELIQAIRKVAGGEKYFPDEVTSKLMADFPGNSSSLSPADSLSKREKEILKLIAQGLTDKEIAEKVFLSPLTIVTHRKNLLSKLGMKNKVELARFAIENNLC